MSISKRLLDDLSRTEPSEFEEERPEYPWPTEEELQWDAEHEDNTWGGPSDSHNK